MIITIDGPAGAGKSSAAKALAHRLGFRFLDTGAMYRAVALAAVRRGLDLEDAVAIAQLAGRISLELHDERVLLDGEDVTETIRTSEITALTRYAANNPGVRAQLVILQRQIATGQNVVSEGRDQGTVAFPDAECKIFLTASPRERAARRLQQLLKKGENLTLDEVLGQQERRDEGDRQREVGPLVPAADAITVLTDDLTPERVVDMLEKLVRQRQAAP